MLCEGPVFTRPLTGSLINFTDCLIGSLISKRWVPHRRSKAAQAVKDWSDGDSEGEEAAGAKPASSLGSVRDRFEELGSVGGSPQAAGRRRSARGT